MDKILKGSRIFLVFALLISVLFACKKEDEIIPTDKEDTSSSDTNGVDTSEIIEVGDFPGTVAESAARVNGYQYTLHLNYQDGADYLRMNYPPQPVFSVGLYAAPGDTVSIDIPNGVSGLSAQIGAWTANVPNVSEFGASIFTRKSLKSGSNEIVSPYGGPIYIIASKTQTEPVTLTFSGAVKQPVFVLGSSNATAWYDSVQQTEVPWIELQGKHVIFTLPKDRYLQDGPADPSSFITAWDEALTQDFYDWTGMGKQVSKPNLMPDLPFRFVLDSRILPGDNRSGYPIELPNDESHFNLLTNTDSLSQGHIWSVYSELGRNFQQPAVWSWAALKNVSNNFFFLKRIHELQISYATILPDITSLAENKIGQALAFSEKDGTKDFNKDLEDDFQKLVPFIQIFEKADEISGNVTDGYDFMTTLSKRARQVNPRPSNDQEKRDFFYETLSDFLQKDTKLFFHAWGIKLSSDAELRVAQENYDLLTKEIWTYNPIKDTGGTSDFDPYKNMAWSVIGFSSEETSSNEKENGGGPATYAIDGDKNTYWHTDWSGKSLAPPHSISIDMNMPLEVGSFYFIQRQSNAETRIRQVNVSVSSDNQSWSYLTTFYLRNIKDTQFFRLPNQQSFQYFKLTMPNKTALFGSKYASLGEVGVRKDFHNIPAYSSVEPGDSYNKDNWTILNYSSQQKYDGGAPNGLASTIIDGNSNTYWHCEYSPVGFNPPHWIIVDMHNQLTAYGFFFVQRTGVGNIRNIKNLTVEISTDKKTWDTIATYHLLEEGGRQSFPFLNGSKKTFRYFRISTQSNADVFDGSKFISLAEAGILDHPYNPYDSFNWSISSNANTGGNATPPENALDGNPNSFWIPDWNANNPDTLPYHLIIDMRKPLKVSSFNFTQRQNRPSNSLNKVEIFKSDDADTWTSFGTFNLDIHDNNVQVLPITPDTFRYFKISIPKREWVGSDPNNFDSQFPCIAEISVNEN